MLLAVLALSACETMQGAGRDMQSAGALLSEQALGGVQDAILGTELGGGHACNT